MRDLTPERGHVPGKTRVATRCTLRHAGSPIKGVDATATLPRSLRAGADPGVHHESSPETRLGTSRATLLPMRLIILPAGHGVRVQRLPTMRDAGGTHRTLALVELQQAGSHSRPHQTTRVMRYAFHVGNRNPRGEMNVGLIFRSLNGSAPEAFTMSCANRFFEVTPIPTMIAVQDHLSESRLRSHASRFGLSPRLVGRSAC